MIVPPRHALRASRALAHRWLYPPRFPPSPSAAGPTVHVRPWRRADAGSLAGLLGCTECEALDWISKQPLRLNFGRSAAFAIVARDSDEIVGRVELIVRDWESGRAEVGYHVASPARGRGMATEAVGIVARWALGDAGLSRVELLTDPRNRASQRVAEKCDFVLRGERSGQELYELRATAMRNSRPSMRVESPPPS